MTILLFQRIFQSKISDPPSEVSDPFEEENTTETTSSQLLTTQTIETTTTTTITTVTTTTSTSSQRTLAIIDEEPILNKPFSTTRKMSHSPSRMKNSSTHQKIPTESIQINYTDRSKLDLCDGFYDAVTMYKGILFIFKGQVRLQRLMKMREKKLNCLVFLAI